MKIWLGNAPMQCLKAASLLFCVTSTGAAYSQELSGGPKALAGSYGNKPSQCKSYHRKIDGITTITQETWTSCSGSGCEAVIVSHKKVKGAVAGLVGIEGGVVSEVINLESSGVEAPDRRYHDA